MNTKYKILTIAIVAMFAATGFIAVANDAAADDSKVTYHIYLQLKDDSTGLKPVTIWLKPHETDEVSVLEFFDALEEGCEAANISYTSGLLGLPIIAGYQDHTDLVHTYAYTVYAASNDKWVPVTSYDGGTTFAIVFDEVLSSVEYGELSDSEKAKYYYNDLLIGGMATKLPATSTTGYDNTMMYIIIAIVVIVIIAVIAIFLLKKKGKV